MLENLEIKGFWWKNEEPDNQFAGTFRYSPAAGAALEASEITEDLTSLQRLPDSATILGVDTSGRRITLHDCFVRRRKSGFTRISVTEYHVRIAIIGIHVTNFDTVPLSEIIADISYLKDWSGISGFKGNITHQTRNGKRFLNGFNIEYRKPTPISFRSVDGTLLTIGSNVSFSLDFVRKPSLNERVVAVFRPKKPSTFDLIYNKVVIFQDFLSLAINKRCTIQELKVVPAFTDDQDAPRVGIYFHQAVEPVPEQKGFVHDALFRYHHVKDNLERFFRRWERKFQLAESSFHLYFASFQRAGLFLDQKFMNYVQALESFHRIVFGGAYEARDSYFKRTYSKLVDAIPACIEHDYKQSLKQKMKYLNEYSLRKRMKDLLSGFIYLLDNQSLSENEFIESVVNTRNYHTHLDPDLKDLAATAGQLYNLTVILESLFKCHSLYLIGFNKTEIRRIMRQK